MNHKTGILITEILDQYFQFSNYTFVKQFCKESSRIGIPGKDSLHHARHEVVTKYIRESNLDYTLFIMIAIQLLNLSV